jgi:hypothetical protein
MCKSYDHPERLGVLQHSDPVADYEGPNFEANAVLKAAFQYCVCFKCLQYCEFFFHIVKEI